MRTTLSPYMTFSPLVLLALAACRVTEGDDSGDVSGNIDPTCEIVSPADATTGGPTVVVEGRVQDAESPSEDLVATLKSGIIGDLDTATPVTGGTVELTGSDLPAGAHLLTLTGADPDGGTCTAEVLYTVGNPPVVIITSPAASEVFPPTTQLTATVSDNEDPPEDLQLEWSSNIDGVLGEAAAASDGTVVFAVTDLTPGPRVLSLTAVDTHGLSANTSVNAIVNGPPGAPVVSIGPDPSGTLDDLVAVIETESVDAEGDPVGYAYAWEVDGSPTGETGASLPAGLTVRGTAVTVVVTPADEWSDGQSGTASHTVGNTIPTVASAVISPSTDARAGDALLCEVSGFDDADGDPDLSSIQWEVNGSVEGFGEVLDGVHRGGDSVVCVVTPNDGIEDGPTTSSAAVVIVNTAPSIASVSVGPAGATGVDTLTCDVSGESDADGDTVTYSYTWTVDDTLVAGEVGSTFSGTVSRDQTVSCSAQPHDGIEPGTTLHAPEVAIANGPPVMSGVTLSPDPAMVIDTLDCDPEATDPDGDPVSYTYTWDVSGSDPGVTGSTLGGEHFDRGQTVTCTATPLDNASLAGTAMSSNTVSIENTPPPAPGLLILPESPQTEDDLVCSIDQPSVDPDGDAVTYTLRWERADSPWTGPMGASTYEDDLIVWSDTAPGERWQCFATANDGFTDGPEGSSPVASVFAFGTATFTPCGASGRFGPSQSACNSAYNGSEIEGTVSVSGGIQWWTVPGTGTYEFTVAGARGGNPSEDASRYGKGAVITSHIELVADEVVGFLVGQSGSSPASGVSTHYNSSGGGGTFVFMDVDDTRPIMAAGGGGGGSYLISFHPRMDASLSTAGHAGINADGSGVGGAGGTSGNGGHTTSWSYSAGAGAGWLSGGQGSTGTSCAYVVSSGDAPRSGGAGGQGGNIQGGSTNYPGGFGGGGGGTGACGSSGAGGGGGYSGGGSGDSCCQAQGGGGGSYSEAPINSSSVNNTGDGYVMVTFVP